MAVNNTADKMKLLFVVLFSVLATCFGAETKKGCSQEIEPLVKQGLMGGWREMKKEDLQTSSSDLKGIVLTAIQEQTDNQNEVLPNSYADKVEIERVFTQVVSGTNYCIVFKTSFCNTLKKGGSSVCKEKAVNCETQVYEPLPFLVEGSPTPLEVTSFVCK